jgi:hypothetical protein
MSLGIAIKGPEGIVLAAESRTTLVGQTKASGTAVLQATFDHATKVFGFSKPNTAVGVVTYGAATIGGRTPHSYIPEFEAGLPDTRLSVCEFAGKLGEFFLTQWQNATPQAGKGPPTEFVVGGFSEQEWFGRVYLVVVPSAPQPVEQQPSPEAFGITWGGQREVVDRLLRGYDHRILEAIKANLKPTEKQLAALASALDTFQLPLPISAMSLQDCVDLAILFVKTTIETQRLTFGVRGCGGPVDVAVITRSEGLGFVQRKSIRGETPTTAL